MTFTIKGRCLEEVYITDSDIYTRFVGGRLWMAGGGTNGILGDGTTICKCSPVQTIASGTNWIEISARNSITSSIKNDGSLWTWGVGTSGVLGDGTAVAKSSPVQTISQGNNWKTVSSGGYMVGAIKNDGSLWVWGRGSHGALGTGATDNQCSPVQTISTGNNWRSISGGWYNFLALKTDGTLWGWGCNPSGQLGDSTTINKCSPTQIGTSTNWRQISAGPEQSSAIKTNGTLWTWGRNDFGQLGDGTTIYKSSPVQIGTNTNWKVVSMGCKGGLALKTDNSLWSWGYGTCGAVGDGTTISKSSPVQTISQGCNWRKIDTWGESKAAIKSDGTLWLWGRNHRGQLGDGTTSNRNSPVQTIISGTGWLDVSTGTNSTVFGFINFRE